MKIEDPTARDYAAAAHRLFSDDTFTTAALKAETVLKDRIVKGKTLEEREQVFQEFAGLRRIVTELGKAADRWRAHQATIESETNG